MNTGPGSCGHDGRIPTPELARGGEVVEFCPTCRRHYSSRAYDSLGLVIFVAAVVGAGGLVAWVLLGGLVR